MRQRIGVLVAICGLVAALASPSGAAARTKVVFAGPPPVLVKKIALPILGKKFAKQFNPQVNAFFLHKVTVNAGDSVAFVNAGFHTIDIPAKGGADLPFIVPGATVTGVNDAAGSPFWFNGHVPSLGLNPALIAPIGPTTYDGSTRIDSGLSNGPSAKPLKIKFTKPGTYKFFCDIHHGMVGYVVVKPKGKPVPSAAHDKTALKAQLLQVVLDAKKLAKTKPKRDHVSVGAASRHGVELYAMFPATLHVKRGTVVTFALPRFSRDTHTASLGPKAYLTALTKGFHSFAFPPAGTYPSDPAQPIPFSPSSHGNGFANTGIIDRDRGTPAPPSASIKFTKPGTYAFFCLIHPFMHGVVIVK